MVDDVDSVEIAVLMMRSCFEFLVTFGQTFGACFHLGVNMVSG